MELQLPTLLTTQECNQLEQLQNNPSPASRLNSNYYQLRQKQILGSYGDEISKCQFYGDRLLIQQRMLQDLDELKQEYNADLRHAMAIYTVTFTGGLALPLA